MESYKTLDRESEYIRNAYCIQACRIIRKEEDGSLIASVPLGNKSAPTEYSIGCCKGLKVGEYVDIATLVNYNREGYAVSYRLAWCGVTPCKFYPKREGKKR